LNVDVVSTYCFSILIHVWPQNVTFPDSGPFHEVAEVPDLCPLADNSALVHGTRGMRVTLVGGVTDRRRTHGFAVGVEAALRGLKNREYSQAFAPVRARPSPLGTAFNEVPAFVPQRFGLGHDHRFSLRFIRG